MRTTLAIATACILLPQLAWAGITKGPYLQDVRPDRITFVAETDGPNQCSISWGENLSQTLELTAEGNHHEAVLTGLDSSTCLSYRITCFDEQSSEYSFCTAPQMDEPFSFVVFGDTRSDLQAHAAVVDAISKEGVDFFINTGDLVSDGTDEEDWDAFFEAEGTLMANLVMYPVVGNHDSADSEDSAYPRLFAPPTDSSQDERYYSFSYGNTRFIVLDNQCTALGRPQDHSTQGDWFASELAKASGNPEVEHLFVFSHANMYSAKDSRGGDEGLRLWGEEMFAHGVDFVFSGHDHHYVRGVAPTGVPFVITGGGGAPQYDIRDELETQGEPVDATVWGWLPEPGDKHFTIMFTSETYHYLRIDVRGSHYEAVVKEVVPGTEGPLTEIERFGPGGQALTSTTKDGCGCGHSSPSAGWGLFLAGLLALVLRRRAL